MGCASHHVPISFISLALVNPRWTMAHNRGLSTARAHSNIPSTALILDKRTLLEPKVHWLPIYIISYLLVFISEKSSVYLLYKS